MKKVFTMFVFFAVAFATTISTPCPCFAQAPTTTPATPKPIDNPNPYDKKVINDLIINSIGEIKEKRAENRNKPDKKEAWQSTVKEACLLRALDDDSMEIPKPDDAYERHEHTEWMEELIRTTKEIPIKDKYDATLRKRIKSEYLKIFERLDCEHYDFQKKKRPAKKSRSAAKPKSSGSSYSGTTNITEVSNAMIAVMMRPIVKTSDGRDITIIGNAVREGMRETEKKLEKMELRILAMNGKLDNLDKKFDSLDSYIRENLSAKISQEQQIDDVIFKISQNLDQRMPIFGGRSFKKALKCALDKYGRERIQNPSWKAENHVYMLHEYEVRKYFVSYLLYGNPDHEINVANSDMLFCGIFGS